MTLPDDTEPSAEAWAVARGLEHDDTRPWDEDFRLAVVRALDRYRAAGVEAERAKIARRVSERRVLRLEASHDLLAQANEIIQDLAHDIETNWAAYKDDEP